MEIEGNATMDFDTFKASLDGDAPPAGAGQALQALWREAKGDRAAAHELAQSAGGPAGAWVHAYLHRVEGDEANAGYWYRRAGKPHATMPLKVEWEAIARALCAG
jgi:hypothetical protein